MNYHNMMLAIAQGVMPNALAVNKFGRATNVDSGVATDIHDGAHATEDLDIWVAPTQARIHNIKSSSASDDGSPVGVGARTLRIYGLTAWDTQQLKKIGQQIGSHPARGGLVVIGALKLYLDYINLFLLMLRASKR